MTKELMDFEHKEITCGSSNSSNSFDDYSSFQQKIVEEEEKLLIENVKAELKEEPSFAQEVMLVDYEDNFKTDEEIARDLGRKMEEAEIKERKYKSLIHLLNSSQMYSVLLRDRLNQDEEISRKKGRPVKDKNLSASNQKPGKSYKLGDVITKENIDETVSINEAKEPEEKNEDYFKETRVTKFGFTVSWKQPILLEGGMMRDYQLKGLDWMKSIFSNGVNGILADEMGLGKTIQVISFVCHLIEQDIEGPFLVVAPLTTLHNWASEFKRFAPKVPTLVYHGSEAERMDLRAEIYKKHKVLNKSVHSVIITSFQVPIRDKYFLGSINWYYLIIDEGHRIKNHNSLLSKTLRKFNTIGRLLLTGTPLQNDLSELWSLLNFLLPEVFNSLDVFESWFDIKELESNGTKFMEEKFNINIVNILQEILVPFLLRRKKTDVNLNLPPKKEILINCPLTAKQKQFYQATLDCSIEELLLRKKKVEIDISEPLPKRRSFLNSPFGKISKEESPQPQKNKPRKLKKQKDLKSELEREEEERFSVKVLLQNPQMQLRKIVNHPYLVQFPLKTGTEELRIDEDLIKASGKMLVLDAMLSKLHARGNKVIIFSCFTTLLDILEEHAIMRNYSYCRLDGKLNLEEREEEISKFVTNPDIFVFYISVRAGGLGINLTAADTVIFFDSDWNPQVNLQSQDRCHRIGQTKPVVVYRLCANGTIDEKIIERGNAKRRLEKMILQEGKYTLDSKDKKKLSLMDFQELKELLSFTDHDMVINSNGFVLSDEELEALLDRSGMESNKLPQENKDSKLFKILSY